MRQHFFQVLATSLVAGLLAATPGSALASNAKLWAALRAGGHLVLIRHAIAPGTGDPENFTIGDCSSQRNLSQDGRDQAARIGARFRANGIATAKVYSSQWCRCLETARHLGLGSVTERPFLNSLHARSERTGPQTRAFRNWLEKRPLKRPEVLVTHQATIRAFTGRFTASGEMVVARRSADGGLTVVGTIQTD
ncbi:MAG: histidine phosphatase family protein [Alphaproteobacteria bacterium]